MPKVRHAALAWLLCMGMLGALAPASASPQGVTLEAQRAALEPYGSWYDSSRYGRVWIPRVQVIGWHPYTYGHWEQGDLGWTWVSAYEWGAIPYHYGTWALDPELGWAWVPGEVWAPAWVMFRSGPSYVGWAPVPPGSSFADPGADHYVFVRKADLLARNVHRVAVPSERARAVFAETQIVAGNQRLDELRLKTRETRPPRPGRGEDRRAPHPRG